MLINVWNHCQKLWIKWYWKVFFLSFSFFSLNSSSSFNFFYTNFQLKELHKVWLREIVCPSWPFSVILLALLCEKETTLQVEISCKEISCKNCSGIYNSIKSNFIIFIISLFHYFHYFTSKLLLLLKILILFRYLLINCRCHCVKYAIIQVFLDSYFAEI